MSAASVLAVALGATAALLAVRPPPSRRAASVSVGNMASGRVLGSARPEAPAPGPEPGQERALLARLRAPLTVLAGAAGWAFLGGALGIIAAGACAAVAWRVLGGVESPAVARRREQVRAELPVAVDLIGACLGTGGAAQTAFGIVADALPGPTGEELAAVHHRLQLGVDPRLVWADLAQHEELAPLGRALARAYDSGAGVAAVVSVLAEDLRERARAEVEERARSVDVRAAAPLGVCLLPAFLLLGVIPMVAGLFTAMDLFG